MKGEHILPWANAGRAAALAAALCLYSGALWADTGFDDPDEPQVVEPQRVEPPPVEGLLDRLADAESEMEARRLEVMILQAWRRSASPTVNLLLDRAASAMQDEEYGVALHLLDAIVELAPGFAEAWNMRATVYYRINEFQLSINDIGRTLALQPRHFGALSGLGMIFNQLDDKAAALSALRRALEVHPHFGDGNIRNLVDRLEIEVEGRGI